MERGRECNLSWYFIASKKLALFMCKMQLVSSST